MNPNKKAPALHNAEARNKIHHQKSTSKAPKPSSRWKDLERTAAAKLGGKRVVREDIFEKAPDVLIPDFGLLVECKAYRRFKHHTLLDVSRRKYCHSGEIAALVTKHSGQRGEYCTVPLDWLAGVLDEVRAARKGAICHS